MPEANDDGPFHLRFWMQTKPCKIGMCYNHLPWSLPELAHRIGISSDENAVIATEMDDSSIDYKDYPGLLSPDYRNRGILGVGGYRRFLPHDEWKRQTAKELVNQQYKSPDEIDLKLDKEEWRQFLQRIEKEGDPMALCNLGYCFLNGARSSVGIIFEEIDIDAPQGHSTGTEIAAFVHDAKSVWDTAWGERAIDLARVGELEVGDRIVAVDGVEATDSCIYGLLCADGIPGSMVTITVQKRYDVEQSRQKRDHKFELQHYSICRVERTASKRDQIKQKAIEIWKKAAERG
jgi:hypothetical protein